MLKNKPLLVLLFLMLASVACYSDSPLWVFGVTDTPPTATFLPTPDTVNYPSKLTVDDTALAPQPSAGNRDQPFFFIASVPADLLTGARNASGSCDWGEELEILYIGHEWLNFTDSVYLDDMVLTSADETTTLFDFEEDVVWTIVDDGMGSENDSVQQSSNIDFTPMRDEDASETLDVSNTTRLLEVQLDFAGEDWSATIRTDFEAAQDWTGREAVSMRVFAPNNAERFSVQGFVVIDGTAEHAGEFVLTPGQWTEGLIDLSDFEDLSNVNGLELVIGPTPSDTWYLVACAGSIGWASEDRIAGPVLFSRGQSALTQPISHTDTPIVGAMPFSIYGGPEPPISTALPPTTQCSVNEVVEILNISSIDQELWYEIRCTGGTGWLRGFRLFGPLPLPSQDGNGVIRAEFESYELAENPGTPSDENPAIGECAANDLIQTIDFQILSTDDDTSALPYYLIECGDVTGWIDQEPLIEIPYLLDTLVLIVGGERTEIAVEATDEAATDDATDISDETEPEVLSEFLPVPIASEPAIPTASNTIGECPSGSVVRLEDVASIANLSTIVYQITCDGINGWVEARFLPNEVLLPLDTILYFVERTTENTDPQTGHELTSTPSQIGTPIGACALFESETPARISAIQFEQKALKRLGYRLYYEVTCINEDGEELVGWSELELELDKLTLRDPIELLGN